MIIRELFWNKNEDNWKAMVLYFYFIFNLENVSKRLPVIKVQSILWF